jgi:peptidoglycan/LPS O-acetylase OafA/YrhL
VALIGSNPVATFYLPFTRAWELLAGAVLACSWNQVSQTGAASNLRASIGLALIATAAGVLDTKSAFPGWWAVLPVAGAALLLSAPAAWSGRGLAGEPAAGLDRIDQLSAVSVALAAAGIFRNHQIRATDAGGA